ncbi:MAG: N-acetylneuraminate synthase family protein [Prochlorococcus marinus CUG1439]|uniref:N-acetylneuraminate synthase family protein n=1 Tax=Prochlorococcus sp. MIT 1314 TaxID=3096220 RepID=UPI001B186C2C|nr:N-acetylneuraminate synthase family protein [Prochlorococcus sp. MIT 1314]MCR8538803.1 N-acetylneuraminate synthase family protein [Prochlorococcus marinus CUG1439]
MTYRIIFEIANNHQGRLSHFEGILKDITSSINSYCDYFDFIVKFQFRDIPSFIDKTIDPNSNKHIPRFLETQLSDEDWKSIFELVHKNNLKVMVTPFDEASVAKAINYGVDELKIASCSSTEWSLIEACTLTKKPLTISTAGRNLNEIDNIYSYLSRKMPNKFTIMHCCGIYPAPLKNLNLSFIPKMIKRYPLASIGYSGHEDPHNHNISSLAIALGAISLERHVGKVNEEKNIKINAYSVDSKEISNWLESLKQTIDSLGSLKTDNYYCENEASALESLQRGVFTRKKIRKGEVLNLSNCEFKFPIQKGQISAAELTSIDNKFIAKQDLNEGLRLNRDLTLNSVSENVFLKNYIHKIRGLINEYCEYIPNEVEVEISHHYGIDKIFDYGCCIINIINRSYCKKLILMTKGQNHPTQYHLVKEETFRILHGEIELILDGNSRILKKGDEALVRSSIKHSFNAISDCIIEELSTTSIKEDSYYSDKKISDLPREHRKSIHSLNHGKY